MACALCDSNSRLWPCRAALLLFALIVLAAPAYASKSATEFFEPVVTHRQFTDLVRQLDLDREQRMIVELVFADYTDAIAALARQADNEADAVGRQTILEAYSGRRLVEPAELRRLRIAVLDTYRSYWPRIDRQLTDMIEGVRSMLTEEQRPFTDAALRQLRRAMLLHPRQVGRSSFEYAGDGVDMLQLIAEASREDGELHGLEEALADIRRTYELQLDEVLMQNADAWRDNRMDVRLARIRRDREAQQSAEQRGLELWRELYELNERTMRQVSDIAVRNGEQALRLWRSRYQQACFPWMFSTGLTDRQYDWIGRQQLTAEQQAQASSVYETFKQRRAELRKAAIGMMLTARKEMRVIVYAMMDQSELTSPVAVGLHQQLLRNSGELASAEAAATAGFESILNDNQRLAMRRAMRR